MSLPSLRDAETLLLARRRAQRGSHTLGDDADRAFLDAVAALAPERAADARDAGRRLGGEVYARRFLDDDLEGAIGTLSSGLAASGAGALRVASAFHREARLGFEPAHALAGADASVHRAYVAGVVEGYLSSAFNCAAEVAHAEGPDPLLARLGDGRDVNAANARGSGA